MDIFGSQLTPRELRRRVGNMDQIAGIRTVTLDDGNERGTRAALVKTGSGLEFTVLLDRCLDISAASFRGKAMGWRSTCGDVAPQFYEAEGARWLRSYFGGLVATCGLMTVGAPNAGSELTGEGLHGRIGNAPAKDVSIEQCWEKGDYVLRLTGTMRETRVFGENLVLKRTITTRLGSRSIALHDELTNEGFDTTRYMLLYHCNIGWPAVDTGSELLFPTRYIAPRDAAAIEGKEDWYKLDSPIHRYAEKVYYHDMASDRSGRVTVAVVNNKFGKQTEGFGVYVTYNKKQLPRFTQWKQMGEQDYVVGLEPCNCGVEGRAIDEKHGLLHALRPGETKVFDLEFGVLTDAAAVKTLRAHCGRVKPVFKDSYLDFVSKP